MHHRTCALLSLVVLGTSVALFVWETAQASHLSVEAVDRAPSGLLILLTCAFSLFFNGWLLRYLTRHWTVSDFQIGIWAFAWVIFVGLGAGAAISAVAVGHLGYLAMTMMGGLFFTGFGISPLFDLVSQPVPVTAE